MIELSKKLAGEGRRLSVFSPRWNGSRPGLVVSGNEHHPTPGPIRVNVSLDGYRDQDALRACRARPEGNTIEVLVYNPLSSEQRRELESACQQNMKDAAVWGPNHEAWAEWPM